MNNQAHLQALQGKREKIKAVLRDEILRPSHSNERVHFLKKENLRIKDQILEEYRREFAS